VDVTPKNYTLEFEPNFKDFTFEGNEIINIEIKKSQNMIKLDAAELTIKKCSILYKNQQLKTKYSLDKKNEKLIICLTKKIKGNAKLCISFTGTLNDRLLGFYRSQYKDQNNTIKYLATTQFEAADARRAFPCWDEPEAKATFCVKIITDENNVAISNMPEISKKKVGKKFHHQFSQTPVMSTYLLYLGVGDFEFLSSRQGNTLIRIVTTKGNKTKAKLSLEFTKKFLLEYEKYFGIKYPLPKLDLIAIPDFAAGAMENWGAITFRETILLYDPKTSSTKTKQFIAEVISHELAHQWFGNLVTMKWWNDLWLNESFATFMATKIVHKFYPTWDLWDQFLEDAMNQAMNLDSLKSSHPIDVKVNQPSEIREIFDSISYDKGGCVLRMLEYFVGKENFRAGLKYYLTKHKYKNATTKDLWNAIERVSEKPVSNMMNSWIKQMGFPLVKVTKQNSHLHLSQRRFLSESQTNMKQQTWHVPLIVNQDKNEIKHLFKNKSSKLPINKNQKILVNSGRTGFFRIMYDEKLLSNLKLLIKNQKLNHVDRWTIQNDFFSFVVAGTKKLQPYLDFCVVYKNDDNFLSCMNLASNLYFLYIVSFNEKYSYIIKKYVMDYFENLFLRLGWDVRKNEQYTDTLLRSFVISALGKLGDKKILNQASIRFNQYLNNPSSLNPDLQEVVFSLVAWQGDIHTHKKLIQLFRNTKTQEEKLRFLTALCYFKDVNLLQKTLDFSLTKDVRSQNIQLPIIHTSSNPYGKKIMWKWMTKNWKHLSKKFGIGNPLANRIVASIALVANDSMEAEICRFFKKNPVPGTERVLKQTLEKIRIRSKLSKRLRQEFKNA